MNNTVPFITRETSSHRYEAVMRISEAIAACREPEELARTLADEIGDFLHFDHLYLTVFKEDSREIEYLVWGKGSVPFPDLPIEELPMWHAMASGDPQHTPDWDTEERFPQFREWAQKMRLGSGVRVPLTTPHRRLGVFGISRDTVDPFSEEGICFLRLVGRVVAFALDDGLNLRRAQSAHACLQSQNERLQLLLNLTNRITSNLQLRELLRAVAANIRGVMQCEAVAVSLVDSASGTSRLYVLDFPQGKGLIKEERVVTISGAAKRALETLKPAVVNKLDPSELPPEVYDEVVAEGLESGCLIPLINRGRALGILSIGRTTEAPFTSHDIEFLTQAAGQIAIAIENALAYHEISELKDKLAQEKFYLEDDIRGEMNFENIFVNSPKLKHFL
jgi:formate hydrogenlyase transcriptional activator